MCPGHGPKYISKTDYAKNIKGIEAIFAGKVGKLKAGYKKEMKVAAASKNFEAAASYRDKLYYLAKIEKSHIFSDRDLAADVALSQLTEELKLDRIDYIKMDIEGGDTSNRNYAAVVDIGTTTIVVHLANVTEMTTVDAEACFNSQAVYGWVKRANPRPR